MTTPLASVAGIKERLQQFGLTPNRALGQNFLASERALADILDAAKIERQVVVEIGPGLGALTEGLLSRAARVIAIEKDAHMVEILRQTLPFPTLQIVLGDALKVSCSELAQGQEYHVVSNLPYYITTPIILHLLTLPKLPASMTLMVQQEAAARFFAAPKERVFGPLSILAQLYYEVTPIMELPPSAYWPQPEVHSSVIRLVRNETPSTPELLPFLNQAFSMRRKTLANNLSALGYSREQVADCLASMGYPPTVRAEELSPDDCLLLHRGLMG